MSPQRALARTRQYKELEAAQQRLIDAGQIRIEEYGPPSRAKKRLSIV
jgi:hypothetical protein